MTFWKSVLAVMVGIEFSVILNIVTKLVINKIRWWLLLFPLFLLACPFGGQGIVREPSLAGKNTKRTVQLFPIFRDRWERSGYDRMDDLILNWPVQLAIAGDGTGCIVSDAIASVWREGYIVQCDRWRVRQPRP